MEGMTDPTCDACGEEYEPDADGANVHYCAECREMAEDAANVEDSA